MMEEKKSIYYLKKRATYLSLRASQGRYVTHTALATGWVREAQRVEILQKKKTVNNWAANTLQSSDAKNFQSADTLFNISIGATHSSSLLLLLSAQGERAPVWLRRLPGGFSPTPSRLPLGFCFEHKEKKRRKEKKGGGEHSNKLHRSPENPPLISLLAGAE